MLHARVWKGKSNFSLEKLIQQHRNAFISMQSCTEYVQYQLPTEHTRLGYPLSVIQCNDSGLQSAMASVQINTGQLVKRNSFESTDTYLLPYDPVAKKRTYNKKGSTEISDTSKVEVYSFGTNTSIRKTGVHLRYHKPP